LQSKDIKEKLRGRAEQQEDQELSTERIMPLFDMNFASYSCSLILLIVFLAKKF
jgi:hypothetical protein